MPHGTQNATRFFGDRLHPKKPSDSKDLQTQIEIPAPRAAVQSLDRGTKFDPRKTAISAKKQTWVSK